MTKPRALVLLSGGLDSATCLALARDAGFETYALSVEYGQRHAAELAAAKRVAAALGAVAHRVAHVDLVALALAGAAPSSGAERTTKPYPGVVHVHRTDDAQDYHLVRVAPRSTEVVATDQDQAWSVVSDFAEKVGAQIAINANFYSKTESCGVNAGEGRLWTSVYEGCPMTMAFFRDGTASIFRGKVQKDRVLSPSIGLVAAVSGRPRLVEDGRASPAVEKFMTVRHPRTALGLRKDGTVVILVADGRRQQALGFTGPEMSEIFPPPVAPPPPSRPPLANDQPAADVAPVGSCRCGIAARPDGGREAIFALAVLGVALALRLRRRPA